MPASSYEPRRPQFFDRYSSSGYGGTRPASNYFGAYAGAPRNVGANARGMGTSQHPLSGFGYQGPGVLNHQQTLDFFGGQVPNSLGGGGGAPTMPHPPMMSPQMPAPQMPHGGMFGSMQEGLDALHAQNMAMSQRQPGPSYFDRLAGGQTPFSNQGYGSRYAAAGQRITDAQQPFDLPPLFSGQAAQQQASAFHGMAHPGYGAMGQAPLAMAPTDQQGYMQQMAQQNPGGQFFGGALPAMGMSSGGQQRPMFMGAPAEPGGVGYDPSAFMRSHDMMFTPGGAMTPQSSSRLMNYNKNKASLDAGHAQYMQGWNQKLAGRQALVQQNAMNKGAARRARMGIGDPLDMAMRGNPDIAGMMGMGQLGLQGQQMQNQLGWGALAQQHQAAQFQQHAALMQHIAGADLPPGVKQQYMDQIMGQMGLHGGQGAGPGALTGQARVNYHLTPKQQGEFAALKTPKEKEAWLNTNGIMDTATRQHLLGVGRPNRPIAADWLASGLLNIPSLIPGVPQFAPWPNTPAEEYTPFQRAFLGLPEPASPTRRRDGKPSGGASGSW